MPAPTPYPDVNALLDDLLAGMRQALGPALSGLYLYGSLAGGDFDPLRSDIDFAAATARELTAGEVSGLERLHARLWQSGSKWALKLEGSYVPLEVLRRPSPLDAEPRYPTVNEGRIYLGGLGSDWVFQRHILRESGVVLAGPPPRDLIDPVSPAALRAAILGFLREWWLPMTQNPARLATREYQAYAALTMCRALYTLETGEIASKPAAASWAKTGPGAPWSALIDQARAWPAGGQPDRLEDTLAFIRLALRRAGILEDPC